MIVQHEEAATLYEKVIDQDPLFKEATYNLGLTFELLGDDDNAVKWFKEAMRLTRSSSADPAAAFGCTRFRKGQYEDAMRLFRTALSVDPSHGKSMVGQPLGLLGAS